MRFFVTGTDTDAGKTIVAASLASALRRRHETVTVIKIAQTGCVPHEPGDAQVAAELAGCPFVELARFPKPADPWTAARAASAPPLRAAELAERIARIDGAIVAEGSGGAAVPLNESETLTDVAALCGLQAMLVVGLRLGCINHAVLTREYLARRSVALRGIVLVERWPSTDPGYAGEVAAALGTRDEILGTIAYEPNPTHCVRQAAHLFHAVTGA
jgi:dethiobiotin synthase